MSTSIQIVLIQPVKTAGKKTHCLQKEHKESLTK